MLYNSPCCENNVEFGAWLSLVEHLAWDQGVAGSNPAAPTIKKNKGCRIWCISSKRQPIFVQINNCCVKYFVCAYLYFTPRAWSCGTAFLSFVQKRLPTNLLVRQPLFIYFRSAFALSSKISFTSFSFRPLSRIASTEAFWLTQGLSLPKSILSAPWCRTKRQNFSLDKCSILLPEW